MTAQTAADHQGVGGANPARGVAVATRDVHLAFGSNRVLRGVDLDVAAATTACVIGPSGSGKSTLLRVVNRLLEPDRGDVLLDGRSVLHDNPDALRQRVGMVFQHFNLFPHKTVRANVTLGLTRLKRLPKDEAAELALHHLDRVGLAHKADVRPGNLSGGQQQRVAIARALMMNPEAILFDEPTSALDPVMSAEVLSVIADLAMGGQTMVVVTHSMSFARGVATHVHVFAGGYDVEHGSPEKLFGDPQHAVTKSFLQEANKG